MKKTIGAFILLVILATMAVACDIQLEEPTLVYHDKERPISQIEEIIADELEAENPELDLEIQIDEETDD